MTNTILEINQDPYVADILRVWNLRNEALSAAVERFNTAELAAAETYAAWFRGEATRDDVRDAGRAENDARYARDMASYWCRLSWDAYNDAVDSRRHA